MSPQDDMKMDISETTNSQGSSGLSPEADEQPKNVIIKHPEITTTTTTETTTTHQLNMDELKKQQEIVDKYLDNRTDNEGSNNRSRGLTPVSSHPLMSPTNSVESDSLELNSNEPRSTFSRNYFNFPDVVPMSEQPMHYGPKMTEPTHTLDVINSIENSTSFKKKPAAFRQPSPSDFASSDSEADVSQFLATVEPTFQSVSLVPNSQACQHKSISPKLSHRRKIPLSTDLLVDEISSLDDSVSNHSVDDLHQNLVSISPSSSILDNNGFNVDLDDDLLDIDARNMEQIPQYTAKEEARDIRNWQKVTLPDGTTREIDMNVIDPYKRVLSHGGYLKSGGHNAIVVFSACFLPDRSRADYHYVMNNLFLYVVKTLEQLVTDDYVLVYLHGGSTRGNVPSFPWLKKYAEKILVLIYN
jgi:prune family protein 2